MQTQLLPDAAQARSLRETIERFNEACNWIAAECFTRKEANQFNVRKIAYHEVRERFGLSSQMAQHAIKCVCEAYKRDKTKKVKVPQARGHRLRPADDELQGHRSRKPLDAGGSRRCPLHPG